MPCRKLTYQFLLHSLFPLGLGFGIYLFYRTAPFRFEEWLPLDFPAWKQASPSGFGSDFLLYNLPDGLWFYALLSAIILIWNKLPYQRDFVLVLCSVFTLPYLLETGQYLQWFSGTFDTVDLLAYTAFGILAFLFHHKTLIKPTHD